MVQNLHGHPSSLHTSWRDDLAKIPKERLNGSDKRNKCKARIAELERLLGSVSCRE